MTRIASAQELRRAKFEQYKQAKESLARLKLINFSMFVDPSYERAKHLEFVQSKLEQVQEYMETGGKRGIGRLILSLPPRHSKSSTVSIKWPLHMLGIHPDWRFIIASYGQDKANDFSRAIRDTVANNTDYSLLFPNTILDKTSASVERWHLLGAENPSVIAVGVGGPAVGRGGNCIIIDDIFKSRAEANSATYRENIRRYYTGTLRTRLEPGGSIIICNTRWHEDDLIGNLINQQSMGGEKWEVINLPAICEGESDPLNRRMGDALWPERWPLEELYKIKQGITLGDGGLFEWESQYQGHPSSIKGSKIDITKFKYVDAAPSGLKRKRYWDLALSTREYASFTASCKATVTKDGDFYIEDMQHLKEEWPIVEDIMKKTFKRELDLEQGVEKKLHGLAIIGQFMRDAKLAYNHFRAIDVDASKLDRALPWISRLDAGKVYLVKGPWIAGFIEECRNFTGLNDTWSDLVDSASGVYLMLANPKWKKIKFKRV